MDVQRHLQRLPAQSLLALALLGLSPNAPGADPPSRRFYPDDPICCAPRPLSIKQIEERKTDTLFDFLYNSFARVQPDGSVAGGINTLGEVLDSEWFTNRHGRRRLSLEELRRGPGDSRPPQPPFTVVGAKLDGITPGFRMRDAKGALYFVKPDPLTNPEMATAADVIGTRFFWALGYNTPENYVASIRPEDITVSPDAKRTGESGKPRNMTKRDIETILWRVPRASDGSFRVLASLAVSGKPLGPFRYTGTRTDDPNDLIPHEHRRDLRGLFVLCSWLNHTDAKSINSLDVLVEENQRKYVKHYLIDFGSAFGSDSDMPKNARFGNGYVIPSAGEVGRGIANLGLVATPWEKAKHPDLTSVGRFEATAFDPEKWIPNYPNPAFDYRTPEDEYWGAKQVMAFTDEDIRAIVETGKYSDPAATEYVTKVLGERRDKIGRTYFTKVLALEDFTVVDSKLQFVDLAVKHGFAAQPQYAVSWFRFDNSSGQLTPLAARTLSLPAEVAAAPEDSYFAARLSAATDNTKTVTAFFRKRRGQLQIVGIERTWPGQVKTQTSFEGRKTAQN